MCRVGSMQEISVPSSRFCCEPKSALKKSSFRKTDLEQWSVLGREQLFLPFPYLSLHTTHTNITPCALHTRLHVHVAQLDICVSNCAHFYILAHMCVHLHI